MIDSNKKQSFTPSINQPTNMQAPVSKIPQLKNVAILRTIAIIGVVLYHSYCPWFYVWNWYETPLRPIYSFVFEMVLVGRMPLFVAVSGYLFCHLYHDRGKYQQFLPFLINKVKRLLIPCFTFSVLIAIVLDKNYIDCILYSDTHLWFIKMLFWCFITTWLLFQITKKNRVWGWVIFFASLLLWIIPEIKIFGFGQFCKYFCFFWMGSMMYYYRKQFEDFLKAKKLKYLIGLWLLIVLISGFYYYSHPELVMGDIVNSSKYIVLLRLLLRFLDVFVVFGLVDTLLNRWNREFYVVTEFNKLTYGIYLFHFLIIQSFHKYLPADLLESLGNHSLTTPVVLFIISFGLSYIFSYLIKKTKIGIYIVG